MTITFSNKKKQTTIGIKEESRKDLSIVFVEKYLENAKKLLKNIDYVIFWEDKKLLVGEDITPENILKNI